MSEQRAAPESATMNVSMGPAGSAVPQVGLPHWRRLTGTQRVFTVDYVARRCADLPKPRTRTYLKSLEGTTVKPAAMLVPVVDLNGEAAVIVTKRASHLSHHRGDWVFPGGGVSATVDASAQDAAVRETSEELGIAPERISMLGELDSYGPISSGHLVRVFVGLVDGLELMPDRREVAAEAIEPLSAFMSEGSYFEDVAFPAGYALRPAIAAQDMSHRQSKPQPFFRVHSDELLWGAQGEILASLLEFLADGVAAS
ncbi:NUDIX hydrolase [Jatrophihabitans sp. DSM 45814]